MGWGTAATGLGFMVSGGFWAFVSHDLLRRRRERAATRPGYRTWDGSRPRNEWPPDGMYEMSRGVSLFLVGVGALLVIGSALAGLASLF